MFRRAELTLAASGDGAGEIGASGDGPTRVDLFDDDATEAQPLCAALGASGTDILHLHLFDNDSEWW
jgi:hypothetical protein